MRLKRAFTRDIGPSIGLHRAVASAVNIHTYIHTNLYSAKNRENESEALAQNY